MTPVQTAILREVEAGFAASVAFLAELVKVPSDNPPGDCAPHGQRAAELLKQLGHAVEVHPVGTDDLAAVGMISATNLIVRQSFGSAGPCIALNAHGDVVAPGAGWSVDPYGAVIRDDPEHGPEHGPVMIGRGVAVSKSDFATYSFALQALQRLVARGELRLRGSVELHFTYDEEVGGEIGPAWLLRKGLTRPDFALSAGFAYAVTTAHNGCLHLEVNVHGRQGHAAMPKAAVDALEAATGILAALYDSRAALAHVHSATAGIDTPTLNIGLINGGINTNVVPDRVSFRIDRRIIPEESAAAAEATLRALIAEAAARYPGIQVEVRQLMLAQPLVKLPGAEQLTDALQRHGEVFLGSTIAEHGVPLYTDARHYAAAGIPTVLYGAGPRTLAEANGHGADECLRLRDLKGATATVAAMLAELLAD